MERGEAADRGGRWRVSEVLDANASGSGGILVLVSWANGDASSWKPLGGCMREAREEAHRIVAAR